MLTATPTRQKGFALADYLGPRISINQHIPEPLYREIIASKPPGISRTKYLNALLLHGHRYALKAVLNEMHTAAPEEASAS